MTSDDVTPTEPPAPEQPSSTPPPASASASSPAAGPPGTPAAPPPPTATTAQPDTQLLMLKDKVQRYLSDLVGPLQLTATGDFSFQFGSARVFVNCTAFGDAGDTVVRVTAPVLFECKPSPDLYEHVATHADDYLFGHLSVQPQHDGTVSVMFTHILLGDFLDPEELKRAVGGVVTTADQIDDELKARFGGKRFHDDVA
jgi:hypothetical protein